MASDTAQIALYFGEDDPDFLDAVSKLRFSADPPLEFEEMRKILVPIWGVAFDQGYREGLEQGAS